MIGKRATLGFWLRDTALQAALVQPVRKGWKTVGSAAARGEALLSAEHRRTRLLRAFLDCRKSLPRLSRRADVPAVLGLPDSYIAEDILTFSDFPKATAEARALVAHRMSRETGDLPEDLDVAWEIASQGDRAVVARVRAMNKPLREDIEAAATDAGLRLVRIDGWIGYASAEVQLHAHAAGAAVWSDGAEWSLLCWSADDAAGFCQQGTVEDPANTAADIVRLSLSYFRANEIAAGPLSADVTEDLLPALSDAAGQAGLEAWALPTGDRAAQVAIWA